MTINPSELQGYGQHRLAEYHEQADTHQRAHAERPSGPSPLGRLWQLLGALLRAARVTRAEASRGAPPAA